jgi:hypothetical protein
MMWTSLLAIPLVWTHQPGWLICCWLGLTALDGAAAIVNRRFERTLRSVAELAIRRADGAERELAATNERLMTISALAQGAPLRHAGVLGWFNSTGLDAVPPNLRQACIAFRTLERWGRA